MKVDETIKMLEQQKKHATDPALKKSIEEKIKVLRNNKTVEK